MHTAGAFHAPARLTGRRAPQVEAVLVGHPAVAAAAVVGLPHERLGEQVSALVALRPGWRFEGPVVGGASCSASAAPQSTSLADLQAHCRSQGLAGFRLPRFAAALPAGSQLPLNASGKVAKPAVREALLGCQGGAVGVVAVSRL